MDKKTEPLGDDRTVNTRKYGHLGPARKWGVADIETFHKPTGRQPQLDHVRKRSYIPHTVVDGSPDAGASANSVRMTVSKGIQFDDDEVMGRH